MFFFFFYILYFLFFCFSCITGAPTRQPAQCATIPGSMSLSLTGIGMNCKTVLLTDAVTDTNELSFAAAHGLASGTAVVYSDNSETTITGLTDGTTYYVLAGTTASKMKLEASLSSGAITIAAGQGASNNKVTDSAATHISVQVGEAGIACAIDCDQTTASTLQCDVDPAALWGSGSLGNSKGHIVEVIRTSDSVSSFQVGASLPAVPKIFFAPPSIVFIATRSNQWQTDGNSLIECVGNNLGPVSSAIEINLVQMQGTCAGEADTANVQDDKCDKVGVGYKDLLVPEVTCVETNDNVAQPCKWTHTITYSLPVSSVTWVSNTKLNFLSPPFTGLGMGVGWEVQIIAGGQSNLKWVQGDPLFSYDIPVVEEIPPISVAKVGGESGIPMTVKGKNFADVDLAQIKIFARAYTTVDDENIVTVDESGIPIAEVKCLNVERISLTELRCMYPNVGTAGTSTHLIQVEISGQTSLGNGMKKRLFYKTEVFDKFLAEGVGGIPGSIDIAEGAITTYKVKMDAVVLEAFKALPAGTTMTIAIESDDPSCILDTSLIVFTQSYKASDEKTVKIETVLGKFCIVFFFCF